MITDLNDPNELVMFSNSILEKKFFHTFFGELEDELFPLVDSDKQDELLHLTQISKKNCTIVYSSTCIEVDSSDCTTTVSSSTNVFVEVTNPNIWTLYFDGSKNKEGAGDGYLLIDPRGNRMMLACHLKFDCMNNVVEYEALVQGLRKALNFKNQMYRGIW